MSTHVIRNLGSLAVAALLVGCFDEQREPLPVAPPSTLEATIYTISGQVLGPDGSTICDFVPDGATVFLRVIDPATATPGAPFAGGQNLTCPVNSFAIAVAPGTYRLRVEMPDDPSIGALPFRHLEPGEVVVGGMDVVKDVQVLNGEPMGGSMTIDGTPLAGGLMTLIYDLPTNVRFGAAFGITGPDGEWDDRNPDRSPMRVQNNAGSVPYRASLDDCPTLGTRVLSSDIPSGSFFFPTQVSAIDCAMETGPATDFSHSLTRLVVTPLPGDIGGQSPELFDEYGRGWGVQFPIGPSEAPVYHPLGASHLWLGGLLVGVVPGNVVLSGIDVGGLFQCGGACRDLGLDGAVRMDVTGSGKKVTWSYSDAPSPEGVGLSVVQRSLDGKPPYDYVMFDYTFENTGPSTITFYAGFFGDWDVGPNAANDIGFTALDGQLMYQTNVGEIGAHVGTLLNSDYPISGNFFFNNITNPARLPLADQIEALRGGIKRLSIGPADGRYIHAVGPITLEPDKKALLSIAVVAGESKAQLIDNAQAAAGEKPKKPKKFGGTLSTTSLEFGATLIVEPASSLPWDNDEEVRIAGLESSWIAESSVDRISFIVPRLEVGPTELRVYFQGPDQVTEYADVEVASTFTPVGTDEYANGPEISNGPFPMEYFIELSNEDPDHVLTIAPAADLDLTVTLQWMTGADLDILWRNADFTEYVGNFGGATAAKPEQTSVTVPGGETWRLWFNKWDSSAPPTLALVTIQSP